MSYGLTFQKQKRFKKDKTQGDLYQDKSYIIQIFEGILDPAGILMEQEFIDKKKMPKFYFIGSATTNKEYPTLSENCLMEYSIDDEGIPRTFRNGFRVSNKDRVKKPMGQFICDLFKEDMLLFGKAERRCYGEISVEFFKLDNPNKFDDPERLEQYHNMAWRL